MIDDKGGGGEEEEDKEQEHVEAAVCGGASIEFTVADIDHWHRTPC